MNQAQRLKMMVLKDELSRCLEILQELKLENQKAAVFVKIETAKRAIKQALNGV